MEVSVVQMIAAKMTMIAITEKEGITLAEVETSAAAAMVATTIEIEEDIMKTAIGGTGLLMK
jgi:hypothetical protein